MAVILLIVVLLAAAMAAFAADGRRKSSLKQSELTVRSGDQAWTQDVLLVLSGLTKTSASLISADVLQVRHSRYPAWAVFVAIAFFPLGLLALLAKQEDIGTMVTTDNGDGTLRVQLKGYFYPGAIAGINSAIIKAS
jgi:hypothetical protein